MMTDFDGIFESLGSDPDKKRVVGPICGACGQPLAGLSLEAHHRLFCTGGVVLSLEQRVERLEKLFDELAEDINGLTESVRAILVLMQGRDIST